MCLGTVLLYLSHNPSLGSRGSISNYYAQLEKTVDLSLQVRRERGDVHALAVHRGLGPKTDTTEHYRLIEQAVVQAQQDTPTDVPRVGLRLMDAGCGMGAGILYFGRRHNEWVIDGYTIAESQFGFINKHLMKTMLIQKGDVWLSSYNEPRREYDAIYAIESLWYSPSLDLTLGLW